MSASLLLTARAAVAQVSGLNRGQMWFLKNGLLTQGAISDPQTMSDPFHIATYQSLNYTSQLWEWNTPSNLSAALPWGRWVSDSAHLPPQNSESALMSALSNLSLSDEPNLNDSNTFNSMVSFFNTAHNNSALNNSLLWLNNFGGQVSDASLGSFIQTAHPDAISFDTYPYGPNSQPAGGSPTNWYGDLRRYHEHANQNNTPLGIYRQTYASPNGSPSTRLLSESELRLQTFAALAFNAKMFSDFTYNGGSSTLFDTRNGANGDSNPLTPLGQADKTINQMLKNVSPTMVRLTSIPNWASDHTTNIMFVRGQNTSAGNFNAVPIGFLPDSASGAHYTDWDFSKGNDPYMNGGFPNSTVNLGTKNGGLPGDMIISWFQPLNEWFDGDDWNSEKYLMVVNGLADMNGTAADTQQSIALDFSDTGNTHTLQVLDPATGAINDMNLPVVSGGKRRAVITLDGGSALIFKFKDGAPFVGTLPPDAIWQTGATGTFSIGSNWDTGTAPSGSYFVHFGTLTTGAGPYNVNFGSDVVSTGAFIHRDNTTWNLNGHTYTLNGFAGVDSLIVGMYAGENGQLRLAGGTLNVADSSTNFSQIGKAAGATGIVTVGAGATWINRPTLLIGKLGSGTLNVNASLTATPNGAASFSNLYLGGSATTFTTGSGVLNVNGGSVSVSGTLKVWNSGTSSINLSAGTLSVGTLDTNGNPARLNFSAGTLDLTASSLTMGSGPLSSVTLSPNKTLRVSGVGSTFKNSPGSVVTINGGRLYGRDIDLTAGGFTFTSGTIEIDGGPLRIGTSSGTYSGAITGTGSLTKSGANAITLSGSNGFTGSTNVAAGTLIFATAHLTSAALNVSDKAIAQLASGGANVLRTGTINTNTTGRIDLNDNPAIIDYSGSSPAASIRAMIKSGYNNGAWNGPGIMSTLAQTSATRTAIGYAEASSLFPTFPATYAGQTIDSTTIVTRYTVMGDADFSGKTDLLDFNLLAANFGKSNMTWRQGDFDYSGTVDILDFNLLAASFGRSSPNSAPPAALRIDAARFSGDAASVPLPSPLKLGAIGLLLAMLATARARRIFY